MQKSTMYFLTPTVIATALNTVPALSCETAKLFQRVAVAQFSAPFDTLRAQYAAAVEVGVIKRSMLASNRFEKMLDGLEKLTLGPLARQV